MSTETQVLLAYPDELEDVGTKKTLLAIFVSLVLVLGGAGGAEAWSVPISGTLDFSTTYFTSDRRVNVPPWEIAALKTGGSTVQLAFYGCKRSAGTGAGPFITINSNNWVWLRAGATSWVEFCIAAKGTVGSTFYATLDWDWDVTAPGA